MRSRTIPRLLWWTICVMVPLGTAYSQTAQTGTLAGTVTDASNNQPLPAATVLVVGTNNGSVTDLEGRYVVNGVEAGRQKIKVSYVGYRSRVFEVTIKPNGVNKLNVALKQTAVRGKTVVVTAQREGQEQAIAQQVSSNTIVNVVAPDRLRDNPDANAAEAIGRLPGISLIRSGGVGQDIVIRGLAPKYAKVMLNGIELPPTSVTNNSTNISGLSEYMLEKVEVFKSIMPDMEANAVAGAVNLTLAPAPEKPELNIIAEPGYNHQNNYFGNYILDVQGSKRFFSNRLGIRASADVERANRGTETLGGSYTINSNITGGVNEPVLLTNVSLNNISNITEKQAGSLVMDWQFSPLSKLFFSNFFSATSGQQHQFTKEFQPIYYNYYDASVNNGSRDLMYSGLLRGENNLGVVDLDYGIAFSQDHNYDPLTMNWQFRWLTSAFPPQYTTDNALSTLPVSKIISANLDTGSTAILQQIALIHMGYTRSDNLQKNREAYLNAKFPFQLSSDVAGYFKVGGEYKDINRSASEYSADQPFTAYNYATGIFPWLSQSEATPQPAAIGFATGNSISNFMNKYDFGWTINFNRLVDYWNWWNKFSQNVIKGDSVMQTVGSDLNIGFVPDFYGSSINNQSITQKYYATYLMAVLNLGSMVTFIPGARYEKLTDNLLGYEVNNLAQVYSLYLPRVPVTAQRSNQFILPNFHLKIKPLDWLAIQGAYTKTLGRPNFNQITPDIYINKEEPPFVYQAGNPDLQPEQWSSYDVQVAAFGNGLGLISVDGFYKEVKNAIWNRTFTRIPGDPLVPGFGSKDEVNVTETTNHHHIVYVRGAELEWQTNFWYLPKPFSYFTLDLNYTFMKSETQYPAERLYTVVTLDSVTGRPTAKEVRVDSAVTGRMLNQPNNIANCSLGFNWKGLNLWISYQFNGNIFTSWNNQPQLIGQQSNYQRWDLQATEQLPIKGLKLRCDIANINNEETVSTLVGNPRPTYIQSYGWTSDFGLIYNF